MKKLVFGLLFLSQLAFSQEKISLEQCRLKARENYPLLKNKDAFKETTSLQVENLKTMNLPDININGQATIQSEVTSIDLSIPNVTMPELPHDQYKIYLEVKQKIWDGGISKSMIEVQDALLDSKLKQLDSDIYKIEKQVNELYLSILLIDEQVAQLNHIKVGLVETKKQLESAYKHGTIEEVEIHRLQAEIFKINTSIENLEIGKKASVRILKFICKIEEEFDLVYPDSEISTDIDFSKRLEKQLFKSQKYLITKNTDLIKKNRKPTVFAFGQAGYGRPGLNMLSDEFNPYALAGIGLSWKVTDWKKTKREIQQQTIQSSIIDNQENTLDYNLKIQLEQQMMEIQQFEAQIQNDKRQVEILSLIADNSKSKLRNGKLSSAIYVQDIEVLKAAKIQQKIHELQLLAAKIEYNNIKGM